MRFDVRQLNVLKNRTKYPSAMNINSAVTLAAMSAPGEDWSRFSSSDAATIAGYVEDVRVGGIETANCNAVNVDAIDAHINVVLDPTEAANERRHVVVEVTPRMRALARINGEDWRTETLRKSLVGRTVSFTGWLLFDQEHADEAANTAAPDAQHIWRATAWEIHPVTAIRLGGPEP